MFAMLEHELWTPLSELRFRISDLAERVHQNPEIVRRVDHIRRATEHLCTIVDSFAVMIGREPSRTSRPRVLFVDDEIYQHKLFVDQFRSQGCIAVVARSIREARNVFQRQKFDIVIVDIMMEPETNSDQAAIEGGMLAGLPLAEWLSEQAVRPFIVLLTNSSDSRLPAFVAKKPKCVLYRKSDVFPDEFATAVLREWKAARGLKENRQQVLFIHGLGSTAASAWGSLRREFGTDTDLLKRIALFENYEYPTSLWRLPFSAPLPNLQDLAAGLRTFIENSLRPGLPIVMMCHSLGGLVARQYLVDEVKAKKALRVRKLVLCAVPNTGSDLAKIGTAVSWFNRQVRQLCSNSDVLERLNTDWIKLQLETRLQTMYVIGGLDRIVDSTSAKLHWGGSAEVIVDRGHTDLLNVTGAEDTIYKVLKLSLQ